MCAADPRPCYSDPDFELNTNGFRWVIQIGVERWLMIAVV